jgi:hypothetical protein
MPASSTRRSRPSRGALAQGSLAVASPHEALSAARRKHEKLIAKYSSVEQRVQRLRDEVRTLQAEVGAAVEPNRARIVALSGEIHALFAALLAPDRLTRRERAEVKALYRTLQRDGVIPQDEKAGPCTCAECVGAGAVPDGPPVPDTSPDLLRGVYRRVARAIHPDRAQGDQEAHHRTEVMKEVTVAFSQGDLSRLLQLERLAVPSADAGHLEDETELARRCAELAEATRELEARLERLVEEERSLTVGLALGAVAGAELASFLVESQEVLEHLVQIRDHVRAFSERRISLDDLLAGPPREDTPTRKRPAGKRRARRRVTG